MAAEVVLAFLEEHNRPFSINEIQSGVKSSEELGKAAVQKALNTLVQKGKVKEKLYGKQKIYCVSQKLGMSTNEMNEKLLELDKSIKDITNKTKEIKDQINMKSQKLSVIQNTLTLEEAIEKKNNLEKEIENVKSQLQEFSQLEAVCPKRKAQAEKDYEMYLKEYKKRKRICMDILDTILENYPKPKEQLFEEVGIETDQDQGFSLSDL